MSLTGKWIRDKRNLMITGIALTDGHAENGRDGSRKRGMGWIMGAPHLDAQHRRFGVAVFLRVDDQVDEHLGQPFDF